MQPLSAGVPRSTVWLRFEARVGPQWARHSSGLKRCLTRRLLRYRQLKDEMRTASTLRLRLSVTSPGAIPKRLEAMRQNVKRYVLPPRRSRSFPRTVKIKMSNYDRNRPKAERRK